ncbi:unnamed protein product [Ambrosiozyma monospora]|uniref:Unnamed protein product n=1 Tax=Ambrosiozyma monospora TaxID=43982 RepID=A0ACB5T355_AMBMO|nr:unnamed protein product [Ambrosiozyma monospora]
MKMKKEKKKKCQRTGEDGTYKYLLDQINLKPTKCKQYKHTAFGSSASTGLGQNGFEVSLNYFTGIPDPNILTCSPELKLIVKSLLKRDISTREKGMQEFLTYLKEHTDELNDDLLIITWCQLYAKLSIDISKNVRSIAHQVQSLFVTTLGKHYAKYLKDTIGSWLSGTFDSDRTVSKTCISSLDSAFNSKAKLAALWKIFNTQILNYAYQVFAFETKDTLSDERFTGKDESNAKYNMVILSSIQLFSQVLLEADQQKIELNDTSRDIVTKILDNENFQSLFTTKELSLKRTMYQNFKIVCSLDARFQFLSPKIYKRLTKSSISGLKIPKNVNTILYSSVIIPIFDCLVTITKYDGSFWTTNGKALDRLFEILKIGSVSSNPVYYDVVFALILSLPDDLSVFANKDRLTKFTSIIRKSVSSEKLPQFVASGWKCYFGIVLKGFEKLSENDTQYLKLYRGFTNLLTQV